MIRYLRGSELGSFPFLAKTMFLDRTSQFVSRLGWDVKVNASGEEIDDYDSLDPTYVIWETGEGRHGGSMRFLPTMGRTMIDEHFRDLTGEINYRAPLVWECTRFCVSPGAPRDIAPLLMLGALDFGLGLGLTHAVGVFEARMYRIYRRIGWAPDVFGTSGTGKEAISAGIWKFSPIFRSRIMQSIDAKLEQDSSSNDDGLERYSHHNRA